MYAVNILAYIRLYPVLVLLISYMHSEDKEVISIHPLDP